MLCIHEYENMYGDKKHHITTIWREGLASPKIPWKPLHLKYSDSRGNDWHLQTGKLGNDFEVMACIVLRHVHSRCNGAGQQPTI